MTKTRLNINVIIQISQKAKVRVSQISLTFKKKNNLNSSISVLEWNEGRKNSLVIKVK